MKRKWLKHKKWELTALVGSLVLLAAAVGGIGWTFTQSDPDAVAFLPPSAVTEQELAPVVEVGNEADGEFERQHFRRSDGSMLRTVIGYRNGTTGLVNYRPDGTFLDFTITAKDGAQLRESTYDAAGKLVVDGWEKRLDGTMEWQTETLADGTLKTLTYWQDGEHVFSQRLRDFKNNTLEMTYWRNNGTRWSRQLSYLDQPNAPAFEEDLYNEITGNPMRSRRTGSGGEAEVSYYRLDGSLYFVQHHRLHATPQSAYLNLDATTVYALDGKTVDMEILWFWELKPASITVINADGSKVLNAYDYDRKSRGREVYAADGHLVSKSDTGADPALFQKLDYYMWTKSPPAPENPQLAWEKAETS